jgi:hypothetical protein
MQCKFSLVLLVRSELLLLAASTRICSSTAYSSALKIEAICLSETSVNLNQTNLRHIPGGSSLYSHHYENLKHRLIAYISISICRARWYADCDHTHHHVYSSFLINSYQEVAVENPQMSCKHCKFTEVGIYVQLHSGVFSWREVTPDEMWCDVLEIQRESADNTHMVLNALLNTAGSSETSAVSTTLIIAVH